MAMYNPIKWDFPQFCPSSLAGSHISIAINYCSLSSWPRQNLPLPSKERNPVSGWAAVSPNKQHTAQHTQLFLSLADKTWAAIMQTPCTELTAMLCLKERKIVEPHWMERPPLELLVCPRAWTGFAVINIIYHACLISYLNLNLASSQ